MRHFRVTEGLPRGSGLPDPEDRAASGIYRFENFELDLALQELRENGTRVPLQRKPLQALTYLVQNRDRVVSKRELLDQIWPDVHVTESALTSALRDVRRALGDEGRRPRFIENLRGQGYRFVADVEAVASPTNLGRASSDRRRWLIAVGVLAGLSIALAVGFAVPRRPDPQLTSIAVLPFEDLSPRGDHAWLADAITGEVTEALSRSHELRVYGRLDLAWGGPMDTLAERGASLAEIRALLGVGSALRGSVQRSGDEFRVTVRFLGTTDGASLWPASYTRELGKSLAVQREIASKIAEGVRGVLGIEEPIGSYASRYEPEDVRAFQLLHKANYTLARTHGSRFFDPERILRAIDLSRQALEIDPTYARAHASLAWGLLHRARMFRMERDLPAWREGLGAAATSAERALSLDPTAVSALHLVGFLNGIDGDVWDWDAAIEFHQRAVDAQPLNAYAREGLASTLMAAGHLREACREARRATELDPFWGTGFVVLGICELFRGDTDVALTALSRAAEVDPTTAPIVGFNESFAYSVRDETPPEGFFEKGPPDLLRELREGYERRGWPGVRQAHVDFWERRGVICGPNPTLLSLAYADLRDADRMYDCLEESFALGDTAWAAVAPVYDPYRGEPRFQALLERANLRPSAS